MRKLVVLVALFVSTLAIAQTSKEVTLTLTPYVSAGLSMTDGEFETASYPTVELGTGLNKYLSVGVVFGRGNFDGIFENGDRMSDYFLEGKAQLTIPVGPVNVYGLFGAGNYLNNPHSFIEYGGGISKSITKRLSIFAQITNWDDVNYFTPGVTYAL